MKQVQVIDVREPFEWEAGRIEGSHHIPLSQLPGRLQEIDPDKRVVAVCFAGGRSAYASTFLESQGFQAMNLDGGLKAWVGQGLPLVGEDGAPGRLVHDPPVTAVGAGRRPESSAGGREEVADHGPPPKSAGVAGISPGSQGDEPATSTEDPGELPPDMERLKNDFIEVVFAAEERFGDREPPEDEMRSFMKEWLMSKGRSPEEAEEILNR